LFKFANFDKEEIFYIDMSDFYNLLKNDNNKLLLFPAKYLKILNLNFSSGEKALLNFFAWINSVGIIQRNNEFLNNNNYLFLFDEIDLYAHPLWQQQLLSLLLQQFNKEYNNKHIQIIFTTHSPILLSDVPKSNTIYIKKGLDNGSQIINDKRKETFAANIYDLYNDAFYLTNSFVGDFAQKFVDGIYSDLENNKYDENKTIYSKINLIGDPILKFKLMTLYNRKFYKK